MNINKIIVYMSYGDAMLIEKVERYGVVGGLNRLTAVSGGIISNIKN